MLSQQVKDMAADLPVLCADGQVRTFPGRLLVLGDGLGVALGAMAIYASSGTTGVRPFGQPFARRRRPEVRVDALAALPVIAIWEE